MIWQAKTAFSAILAFLVVTPLAADPTETGARIDASNSAAACATSSAVAAKNTAVCEPSTPYAFDLSEWINQPVVPDHLNLVTVSDVPGDEESDYVSQEERQRLRMLGMYFQDDNDWVQKLRSIDDLSVMTFWQGEAAHLFLGVSEDGVPGLHFKQRELEDDPHDDQTDQQRKRYRETGNDGRPLVHSQSLTYNTPDLSKSVTKKPALKPVRDSKAQK